MEYNRLEGDTSEMYRRRSTAERAIHQRCTAGADRLGTAHCREIHETCICLKMWVPRCVGFIYFLGVFAKGETNAEGSTE